jgi:DNA polymerase III subunit alpha
LPEFAHLHAHSYYSLLEGLSSPQQLVEAALSGGVSAIAMTDHLNLSGSIEFFLECQKKAIHPIFGLEINLLLPRDFVSPSPVITQGPLVLLAISSLGWKNLCELTAKLLDDPKAGSATLCSWSDLALHAVDLICLSGGRRSVIQQFISAGFESEAVFLLHELSAIFPGRIYSELQIHDPKDYALALRLANLSHQEHIPTAATQDIYYLKPEQEEIYRTLTSIRLNQPLDSIAEKDFPTSKAYFPSAEEMLLRFQDFPDAVQNTLEIMHRCQFELPVGQKHFPQVKLPGGITAIDLLRQKSLAGARVRFGDLTPLHLSRLDQELAVIAELGFETVFLIIEEILDYARQVGVTFSSRGSAASSLVAYCLGITTPDPLYHNLYFERFLNPARSTPPDIDTDLCSRRRGEVIQHIFERYGQDRVAMVGTINRYRPRSALGDVAKAHGLSPLEVHQLTSALPYHYYHMQQQDEEVLENGAKGGPFLDLEVAHPSARHQKIFCQAKALMGLPHHLSVHAGGIVITGDPITNLLPVQRSNNGLMITQLDHKALEPLGIIKLDMLGIRGLTVLGDVAECVHSWRRSEYSTPLEVLDDIPKSDADTSTLLENGSTIGCFQIESPGMRATLKEIRARTIDDVMVALALYRPGPLAGGLKDAFVRRHNHQEAIIHLHPALTTLLEDTYGVVLYQEQVLRIAHDLAGFSLAQSDLLRRAMSHFDPGKEMQNLKERFIRGTAEKSNVDVNSAEKIWELMAAFAGYGFPKAHAASYAQIAWRSAWCKTHFPTEFMAAVLANWGGYYSQRVYLIEARRMGLKVRPPHINHSRQEFSVAYPSGDSVLFMGLDQVRGLTQRTQKKIIHGRPFRSLDDFILRVDPRIEEASNLIRCGALEELGTIPNMLHRLGRKKQIPAQLPLFVETQEIPKDDPGWSLPEKMQAQEEILGISVDVHPLELVAPQILEHEALSTLEAITRTDQRVRVACVRQNSHRSRTRRGETILFMTLEDLEGMLDAVIYPDTYRRYRSLLSETGPLLFEGIIELVGGRDEPILRVEQVTKL